MKKMYAHIKDNMDLIKELSYQGYVDFFIPSNIVLLKYADINRQGELKAYLTQIGIHYASLEAKNNNIYLNFPSELESYENYCKMVFDYKSLAQFKFSSYNLTIKIVPAGADNKDQ